MAAVSGKRNTTKSSEPVTYERIAQRAYELYLQRGGTDGDALQDWLAAEQELTAPPVKRVRKTVAAMTTKPAVATTKTVKTTKAASATTTRRKASPATDAPKKRTKKITDQK